MHRGVSSPRRSDEVYGTRLGPKRTFEELSLQYDSIIRWLVSKETKCAPWMPPGPKYPRRSNLCRSTIVHYTSPQANRLQTVGVKRRV